MFRQSDADFVSLLNEVRYGVVIFSGTDCIRLGIPSQESVSKLRECKYHQLNIGDGIEPTKLCMNR